MGRAHGARAVRDHLSRHLQREERLKRFYNSVMARADAVIANSQWTAAHIRSRIPFRAEALVVIPRGIDFARFDPAGSSARARRRGCARWSAKAGDTVICCRAGSRAGRARPCSSTRWRDSKREGHLLRSRRSRRRCAGPQRLRKRTAQADRGERAAGHVVIAGHMNDMPAAYLASDIVVSASTDPEAFGRVAAEAGAMDRPVIATDHGGSRERSCPDRVRASWFRPATRKRWRDALRDAAVARCRCRARNGPSAPRAYRSAIHRREACAPTRSPLYRDLLSGADDAPAIC